MEEIVSLPPMEFFNNDYQAVLDFIEDLGNPKFRIAGNVDLINNKEIKTLGNLVEVSGYLNLSSTNIESLPDNLHVGNYLDLDDTNIPTLPNNLHVSGNLYIGYTNIKSLPDNFQVGRNLYLRGILTRMYSREEIRKIIEAKGGFVKEEIYI